MNGALFQSLQRVLECACPATIRIVQRDESSTASAASTASAFSASTASTASTTATAAANGAAAAAAAANGDNRGNSTVGGELYVFDMNGADLSHTHLGPAAGEFEFSVCDACVCVSCVCMCCVCVC